MKAGRTTSLFAPTSLGEALNLRYNQEETTILAGGTYLFRDQKEPEFRVGSRVLALERVEELKRITRSESHLEVGSCASLASILQLGKKNLPPLLYDALENLCPEHIKPRATLGGNICASDRVLTAVPPLSLLDTRLELRSFRSTRWIPLTRFRENGGALDIRPNEILTRIRIPLNQRGRSLFKRFGPEDSLTADNLVFACLAEVKEGNLLNLKTAFSLYSPFIYHSRELGNAFTGHRVPFVEKDREQLRILLEKIFGNSSEAGYVTDLAYFTILRFLDVLLL